MKWNIINLLNNKTTHPSQFKWNNWVEIIDDKRGACGAGNEIKFKTQF